MYVFKNSLKNIWRNKSRNIMMGGIIFSIILTTVIALGINNTSGSVIDDYKERFSSEVFLRINFEKVREEFQQNESGNNLVSFRIPQISPELSLQIASSQYLSKSIAIANVNGDSKQIKAVDQNDNSNNNNSDNTSFGRSTIILGGSSGNYKLLGDSWSEFEEGTRIIESGDFPQNDYECLLSTDLRELNDIKLGDYIDFTTQMSVETPSDLEVDSLIDGDVIEINGIEYIVNTDELIPGYVNLTREVIYRLKVVGFYEDLNDEYPMEGMSGYPAMNKRNEVLTTLGTLLDQRNANENGVSVSVNYFLKEPALLEDFEAEIRALGLPDSYDVTTDVSGYESIVKPVLGLKTVSLTFMGVVIVLGGIILILLASISIRERKYEIGVLRAMGMKKSRVAIGLWNELLVITSICLVLGLSIGMTVIQPVSDIILKSQVEAIQTNNSNNVTGPGGIFTGSGSGPITIGPGGLITSGSSNNQPLSEMKVTIDGITILEIVGVSLLLASVAGLVSISKITKYEPIKILMERS